MKFSTRSIQVCMMALTMGLLSASGAHAAELSSLDQPITVELKTPLSEKQTPIDSVFEAVTAEEYVFNNTTVPAGTTLRGKVKASAESKVFLRPGYVVLSLEEATFPNGERRQFSTGITTSRVMSPKAVTAKESFQKTLPLAIASAGTSLPLQLATNLSGFIVTPIALGARMTMGAAMEVVNHEKALEAQALSDRVMRGFVQGTGVPGFVTLTSKGEVLQLTPGEQIAIQLEKQGMQELFGGTAKSSNKKERQTVELKEKTSPKMTDELQHPSFNMMNTPESKP